MSTQYGSFDASALKAFRRSTLAARGKSSPCSVNCYFLWIYDWSNSGCSGSLTSYYVGISQYVGYLGTKTIAGLSIDFTRWATNQWVLLYTNSPTGIVFPNVLGYSTTGKWGYLVAVEPQGDCVTCNGGSLTPPTPPNPCGNYFDPYGDGFYTEFYNGGYCEIRDIDVYGYNATYEPADYLRFIVYTVHIHITEGDPGWEYLPAESTFYAVESVDRYGARAGDFQGTSGPGIPGVCETIGFLSGPGRQFQHLSASNSIYSKSYWKFETYITNYCTNINQIKASYGI